MQRRKFIRLAGGLAGAAGLAGTAGITGSGLACNRKLRVIRGSIVGASAAIGHQLRDKKPVEPSSTITKHTVIIGAGVSGLSAARQLHRSGITDFQVLDLEQSAGGNAASGSNRLSAFPWGAHYVPVPNNDLTEYHQLLREAEVITGTDPEGLPVYNEQCLCFDPEERLYINGRWQEGLVPVFGLPENEQAEIRKFLAQMDEFRHMKGSDGLDAFAIPIDHSSTDEDLRALDQQKMTDWLRQQGYSSDNLRAYVNYCTRDDFGTVVEDCSAWAAIHYFASRKGRAANAHYSDVLTWPEGNHFLVKQLLRGLEDRIRCGAMAMRVLPAEGNVLVDYLDTTTGKLHRIEATNCIIAVPQFIAGRLLDDRARIETVHQHYDYMSWMVANILTRQPEERSGLEMCWDNVIHGSESLGYVEATHQLLRQGHLEKNLTYYLPLTRGKAAEERKVAQQRTHGDWVKIVLDDLSKVHPDLPELAEEINVMVWGHAMVRTVPGLIHGAARRELARSVGAVHFAHSDLAGISIFEEAFYQGIRAADKIIKGLT